MDPLSLLVGAGIGAIVALVAGFLYIAITWGSQSWM